MGKKGLPLSPIFFSGGLFLKGKKKKKKEGRRTRGIFDSVARSRVIILRTFGRLFSSSSYVREGGNNYRRKQAIYIKREEVEEKTCSNRWMTLEQTDRHTHTHTHTQIYYKDGGVMIFLLVSASRVTEIDCFFYFLSFFFLVLQ
jgi:hypothetical protein